MFYKEDLCDYVEDTLWCEDGYVFEVVTGFYQIGDEIVFDIKVNGEEMTVSEDFLLNCSTY